MLSQLVTRSAGIDVHKKVVVCTVQLGSDDDIVEETKEFPTFDASLRELIQWLQDTSVELVTMESTGIYWKHLYKLCERSGLDTAVVNARHVKQVPGKKTDVMDSQWLATLGRYGLLRASFIPPEDLRELRLLASYRSKLIAQLSGEKCRLHKVLDDAGIRLGSVVSDINGVSAKAIIQGLIQGQTMKELLSHVRGRLKSKMTELSLALDCPLGARHRYLLTEMCDHIKDLEKRIAKMDDCLLSAMVPYHESWQLLQTIPGIDQVSAAILLILIGDDMERFGNCQQFCSWAGMCPGNNESAGKRKSTRTRKGNRLLRQTLCEIANAAVKTDCQFRTKYQGLVIRRGHKRAVIAVGHKLLRVVYSILKNKEPYKDPGIDYAELVVKKNAPRWIKALQQYGYIKPAADRLN